MKNRTFFSAFLVMALLLCAPAFTSAVKAEGTAAVAVVAVSDAAADAAKAEVKAEEAAPAAEAAAPAEEAKPSNPFIASNWALIPPLLAILLALLTKEVYSSLFIGIVLGGCFVSNFSFLGTVDTIVKTGVIAAVSDSAGIFIFLVLLGTMVCLINRTGATYAFGQWATKHIKSRPGSQFSTFLLGVLIFIDDYFNCLTVGSVMAPITDRHNVSRAKLAFIIDATAAPVCMIAPISSWAAAVSSYASDLNVNGLSLFIKAIPFNFYSLLTLIFVALLIFLKLDYGPMRKFEKNAVENGDLFTVKPDIDENAIRANKGNGKSNVFDLVIPILVLIATCVFALLYVGGFCEGKSFVDSFGDTDATVGLPWGALITVVAVIIYFCLRRVITFKEAMKCFPDGFCAMVPALLILTLATTLKNISGALELKEFIANFISTQAPSLAKFLPAVIFFIACMLAFSTGTSWGTFGILIPIVMGTFDPQSPLLYIGMSACLAGAVCGDHCSPISDTTIMSSAGAQCDHVSHVSTQLPYAITVAAVSFISFLIAGFCPVWTIVFPIAALLLVGTMVTIKVITEKRAKCTCCCNK